jgi:hypothetical protein
VVKLASRFVSATDEVYRLQTGSDPECTLFQKMADQGHYGGRPGSSRQGTYAAAPSGVLLASINSNDPGRIAALLRRALARWEKLPRKDRLLPKDPQGQSASVRRAERFYPKEGLVLHVYTRDLPRETPGEGWRGKAWNQDYAWFTKEEARQLLPRPLRVGQKQEVPAPLIRRIARCHLVDNVRGQTSPWAQRDLDKALLHAEVTAVTGNVVALRLEGQTRAAAEGNWPVRGYWDARRPGRQKRGFEARLSGKATYDVKKERFLTFELVAVGKRWGATQFNVRSGDPGPAPMGVLFTLAPDSPGCRIAPAFFRDYRWDK